jgi:hypothetical protein
LTADEVDQGYEQLLGVKLLMQYYFQMKMKRRMFLHQNL